MRTLKSSWDGNLGFTPSSTTLGMLLDTWFRQCLHHKTGMTIVASQS